MAYARKGLDSDVYVLSSFGMFECLGCLLAEDFATFSTPSRREMLQHLHHHAERGHAVPTRAVDRLTRELVEEGP